MPFTLYQLLWYFFIYAFLGWCLEVVFCTVNSGQWVNRGFLNGPVCPIYGTGMCIVLLVLEPLAGNTLLLFLGSMVLTSALELATGFVLKKAFHTSWWDYSDQPFNIGGYICLKFSLAWGLGGMAAVRLLHPPIARLVDRLPHTAGWVLLGVFGAVLAADLAATLVTLAGLERDLRELEKLGAALRRGSDAVSKELGDAALAADEKLAESGAAVSAKRQEYLALIEPEITGTYRDIASGSETLAIQYEPSFEPEKGLAPVLRESRARDIAAGFCTAGPHREDFSISIDGRAAKVFASQGQQRSVVLSLKMAEAAAAAAITGEHPVLLLDDVLSELDDGRKQYLLTRMREKQTFVTSCDDTAFLKTDGEVYRMNGGVLSRI